MMNELNLLPEDSKCPNAPYSLRLANQVTEVVDAIFNELSLILSLKDRGLIDSIVANEQLTLKEKAYQISAYCVHTHEEENIYNLLVKFK